MRHLSTTTIASCVLLAACNEKPAATSAPAAARAPQEAAFVGAWRRTLLTFDRNANDALDDDERKAAPAQTYGYTYLKLEADGKKDGSGNQGTIYVFERM